MDADGIFRISEKNPRATYSVMTHTHCVRRIPASKLLRVQGAESQPDRCGAKERQRLPVLNRLGVGTNSNITLLGKTSPSQVSWLGWLGRQPFAQKRGEQNLPTAGRK